jgi:hypothetical protein
MFNTLAGYLLRNSNTSSINANSDNIRNEEPTVTNDQSLNEINFTTTPTDDDDCDWLLVIENSNKNNNKSSSDSNLNCDNSVEDENEENDDENGSEFEETQFVELLNNSNERLHYDDYVSQSNLSNRPVRNINAMDESWFITPPPCFTSTGPINMETSPLENLLIEHPSMSVYRITRNTNERVVTDDLDDMVVLNFNNSTDEMIAIEETRNPRHQNRSTTRTSTRSDRIQQNLSEQQTKLIILEKKSWKVADKKSRQLNKRNTLERLNNVHHIAHMGRKKRCDMYNANLNSRCNNNRKC